jgi:lipopolysaccharide transport system ATP-binding protein
MSDVIIQAENISKLFQLSKIGTKSLRKDVNWWIKRRLLKQEDPFYLLNQSNISEDKSKIWALRDINFEIKAGEAWGIIGRNGSGKSTLLKILSRIMKPTTGVVRGRGKVSSLLEVGTGFNQELTGKENVFISGYILGMTKADILKRYDEIVAFSGIEDFLDTPVKRYSSGMYVRLAFAVAAHLEPDILLVDEVLAVGDAEFQKKCLGKMKDVADQKGRTIIFVSHNMQAVSNFCANSIWIDKGRMQAMGDTKGVINNYLNSLQKKIIRQEFDSLLTAPGNEFIKVQLIELIPTLENPGDPIDIRTAFTVKYRFYNYSNQIQLETDLLLFTISGECIFDIPSASAVYNEGMIEATCEIPGNFLNDGSYYFSIHFSENTSRELYVFHECLHFEVHDYRVNTNWYDKWWGFVRPNFPLQLKPVS